MSFVIATLADATLAYMYHNAPVLPTDLLDNVADPEGGEVTEQRFKKLLEKLRKDGKVEKREDSTWDLSEGTLGELSIHFVNEDKVKEVADRAAAKAKEAEEARPTTAPKSGSSRGKKLEATNPCACGCGTMVRRRYVPGHDARHHGFLKRQKALDGINIGDTAGKRTVVMVDTAKAEVTFESTDATGAKTTRAVDPMRWKRYVESAAKQVSKPAKPAKGSKPSFDHHDVSAMDDRELARWCRTLEIEGWKEMKPRQREAALLDYIGYVPPGEQPDGGVQDMNTEAAVEKLATKAQETSLGEVVNQVTSAMGSPPSSS